MTKMPRRKEKSPPTEAETIRTTLTLPKDLWKRIKEIGDNTNPKLFANDVARRLLEHAINEYQLVISVDVQKLKK